MNRYFLFVGCFLQISCVGIAELHGEHAVTMALTPFVLGSHPAVVNETRFPSVVEIASDLGQHCTATIVEGCLITAKHCLQEKDGTRAESVDVYENGTFSSDKEARRIASKGTDFRTSEKGDLAIVKLGKPLPHLSLPASVFDFSQLKESNIVGARAPIVGYGRTIPKGDKSSEDIAGRKTIGSVRIGPFGSDASTEIYTYADPSGIQQGDSGGPLFVLDSEGKPRLIGVASRILLFGIGSKDELFRQIVSPERYSSVSRSREWFDKAWDDLGCAAKNVPADARLADLATDLTKSQDLLFQKERLEKAQADGLRGFAREFKDEEWRTNGDKTGSALLNLLRPALSVEKDKALTLRRPVDMGTGLYFQIVESTAGQRDPSLPFLAHRIVGSVFIPSSREPELYIRTP